MCVCVCVSIYVFNFVHISRPFKSCSYHSITPVSIIPQGDNSTLKGGPLKQVDKFTYQGCSVSSTVNDINTRPARAWTANDRLSVIWKSVLADKIKHIFFHAAVVSILLYGCTTWNLINRMEKKLHNNYTRIQRAILNKSSRQHPTKPQLYEHLPSITKTMQIRRTKHAGHWWRSKDELISDVLRWTPSHGWAKVRRPTRTYIQLFCADTGCSLEELSEAMHDRDGRRKRVREIRALCATWCWWYIYIYMCV